MARILHLTAIVALFVVMVAALGLAAMRGDAVRIMARLPAILPTDLGDAAPSVIPTGSSNLSAVPELSVLSAVRSPIAAPMRSLRTADLTSWTYDHDYEPDPTHGMRHETDNGAVWWGHGPAGGAPRPVVILLNGAGRAGHSMVDMWHETAEWHGLVLVAPDLGSVDGWGTGLPDPRAALDALAHAATLHPVDMDRTVLFGHSRGGIAAQAWADRWDGPWQVAAMHAGTLPADRVRPVGDGIPLRHQFGSQDRTFAFGPGRDAAGAPAAVGHPCDLVHLEQHTHWFYDTDEAIAEGA